MISPCVFLQFFKILIFWVVSGVKQQNTVQNEKKCSLSHFIFWEPYIIWLPFILHLCKMIISLGVFFIFSKFWKGQKMVQNDKKLCLLHLISQEPYLILLSFMVHMCKIIISPGIFFHFFKTLIFWVVRGVKGQKTIQNDKKFCLSQAPYLGGEKS